MYCQSLVSNRVEQNWGFGINEIHSGKVIKFVVWMVGLSDLTWLKQSKSYEDE